MYNLIWSIISSDFIVTALRGYYRVIVIDQSTNQNSFQLRNYTDNILFKK